MGYVYEWFGYAAADDSSTAQRAAERAECPFVPPDCTKAGGGCSVHTGHEVVPVCPKRFYFDDYRLLREIAAAAFEDIEVLTAEDGLPVVLPGAAAKAAAAASGRSQVGAFGHGWEGSGEIKLPSTLPNGARYSVDFVLVVVDREGALLSFVPVEVQSIDTTNSYRDSLAGLSTGRAIVQSNFGMNWENVNKRILPQLITKGLMLQGEGKCRSGMYFITPEAVFQHIMRRLGGPDRFRQIPHQPGAITFLRLKHDQAAISEGHTIPLRQLVPLTISTSDMSLAFISPQNLPRAGAYEEMITRRL